MLLARVATLAQRFSERFAWPLQRTPNDLAGKANITMRFIFMADYTPKRPSTGGSSRCQVHWCSYWRLWTSLAPIEWCWAKFWLVSHSPRSQDFFQYEFQD
jgi:hypothetical protein